MFMFQSKDLSSICKTNLSRLTSLLLSVIEVVVHEAAAEHEGGEGVKVAQQHHGLDQLGQEPLRTAVTLGQFLKCIEKHINQSLQSSPHALVDMLRLKGWFTVLLNLRSWVPILLGAGLPSLHTSTTPGLPQAEVLSLYERSRRTETIPTLF